MRHLLRRRAVGVAAVAVAAGAGFVLFSGSDSDDGSTAAPAAHAAELPPPPLEAAASNAPTEAELREADKARAEAIAHAKAAGVTGPAASMPAASAGSNGSYEPRPEDERKQMSALTNAPDGSQPDELSFLLGDAALPPPNAPEQIQAAISAANQITDQPYKWGGGHASFQSAGYDCSGAVSYALAGGGMIGAPATSGQLMGWGKPGPGRWLTVYANPGHTYVVIAGLRFDTVGNARGSGPRWHPAPAYPSGYAARHLPGL